MKDFKLEAIIIAEKDCPLMKGFWKVSRRCFFQLEREDRIMLNCLKVNKNATNNKCRLV